MPIRFREDPPDTVYVDRGRGFYFPNSGKATPQFKQAHRDHDLKAFWGEDASAQPGNLQEIHLHETAVSWIRHRLLVTTTKSPASETREEYTARLKRVVADINKSLDVEGLCQSFPARVQAVLDAKGDRIHK